MIKRLLFLPLFFFGATALACQIKTSSHLYYGEPSTDITYMDLVEKSDCPPMIQKAFSDILLSSSGTVNTRHLSKVLSKDFKEVGGNEVQITPDRIQVYPLAEHLKEQFNLRKRWYLKELKFLTGKTLIKLNKEESISFECNNCKFTGPKSILVKVQNPLQNSSKRSWLKGKILVRTKVLRSVEDIPINQEGLNPRQFEVGYAFSTNPAKYFTNSNKIVFYKVNKPLTQGQPLSFSDLTPLNLVSMGNPVNVEINNNAVSLSGVAIPLKSGKLGEQIQLRNPLSKKIIIGKVIDFNKVEINL